MLSSGVSPVLPLLVLGLVFVHSLLQHLRALYLYGRVLVPGERRVKRPSLYFLVDITLDFFAWAWQRIRKSLGLDPSPARAASGAARDPKLFLPGVDEPADKIDQLLIDPSRALRENPFFLLVLCLLAFGLVRLLSTLVPVPDGKYFTWSCVLMICGSFFVVVVAFARFLLLWSRLRYLFRALMQLPMPAAYDRLPALVSQTYGRYLDHYDPRLSSLGPRVQQLRALMIKDPRIRPIVTPSLGADDLAESDATIATLFRAEANVEDFGDVLMSATRRKLRSAASFYLRCLQQNYWPTRTVRESYGTDDPTEKGQGKGNDKAKAKTKAETIETMAEEFLAMEFLGIVSQYAAHLRNLANYLALAPLLLVWAVNSYPFLPQRFMLVFLWGAWATIVARVVYFYIEMDRNPFFSHVSRTSPNHVTFDSTFFTSILALVVPILGVILAQFPFVSDSLNQWFGPILRVVR